MPADSIIGESFDAEIDQTFPAWLLPLPTEEDMSNCACWQKFTFTHAQLAAAAMDNYLEALSLPARSVLHAVALELTESCKGGAIATYKASIGLVGDLERYVKLFDVFQAPGAGVGVCSTVTPAELLSFAFVTSIRLHVVSTGANLDQATQGSLTVYALLSKLP